MKIFYKSFQLLLLLLVITACKKLVNNSMENVPVLKAPLSVSVVNDDDQSAVVGVKVIVSRKISPKGDYVQIDTIRTNASGQISVELPYPNYLKIAVDTTYYHKAEQELEFSTENGGKVTLHTTPKYGMAPLEISAIDKADAALSNLAISVESRAPEQTDWLSTGSENTDVNGKLMVSLPYPNDVRVAVADTIKYFPDTVLTILKNVKGAVVSIKTELKPLTVPLHIIVLDKDNSAPLENIGVMVEQKLTGEADFKDIGLSGVTDKDGKLMLNAPYSGEVRIKTDDDVYFFADFVITRLAYEKNRNITLHSKLLSPTVPVELSVFSTVYGVNNKRSAFGTDVKVSYRKKGATTFTAFVTQAIAANGKLTLNIPPSEEFKFEVVGNDQFADKSITYPNVGFTTKAIDLALDLRPAKYPEPLLSNLQVGTLALNNGITLNGVQAVAVDKLGNRYISETNGHRILRVDRKGNTTVLAGTGVLGFLDGNGATAQFNGPWGLAIDKDGNLYASDNVASGATSHRIRKITIDENYKTTVSTIAGTAAAGGANGVGTAATFSRPAGLCYDENRNCLYVAEWGGHRVRKIELATNTVSLIAGSGSGATPKAGLGAAAVFYSPWGVVLSADGNSLYVSSWNGNTISKIRLSDNDVTILGTSKTNMGSPRGLFVSPSNQVFLSNTSGHYISKMQTEVEGNLSTFVRVTSSGTAGNVDGAANVAQFNGPIGLAYDPYTGTFYIADGDKTNNKVRTMRSSDL